MLLTDVVDKEKQRRFINLRFPDIYRGAEESTSLILLKQIYGAFNIQHGWAKNDWAVEPFHYHNNALLEQITPELHKGVMCVVYDLMDAVANPDTPLSKRMVLEAASILFHLWNSEEEVGRRARDFLSHMAKELDIGILYDQHIVESFIQAAHVHLHARPLKDGEPKTDAGSLLVALHACINSIQVPIKWLEQGDVDAFSKMAGDTVNPYYMEEFGRVGLIANLSTLPRLVEQSLRLPEVIKEKRVDIIATLSHLYHAYAPESAVGKWAREVIQEVVTSLKGKIIPLNQLQAHTPAGRWQEAIERNLQRSSPFKL